MTRHWYILNIQIYLCLTRPGAKDSKASHWNKKEVFICFKCVFCWFGWEWGEGVSHMCSVTTLLSYAKTKKCKCGGWWSISPWLSRRVTNWNSNKMLEKKMLASFSSFEKKLAL